MFILRVYADDSVYEYEYGLKEHALTHMAQEKDMCILTEYKDDCEYLIECKAEKGE